jgi:SHS2 domain-containing protein
LKLKDKLLWATGAFYQRQTRDPEGGTVIYVNMKRYEFFNHTADVGIRIFGSNLAELFENAGFALFDIITDIAQVREREMRCITVTRDSVDELLVEWLSQLLYLNATELLLCHKFHIREIAQQRLTGEAWGEIFQDHRHVIKTEVKAVTYHGLSVYEENGLWKATVVLDV